jgi:site-specific recombinase XerD
MKGAIEMAKRMPEPIAGDPGDPHGFPALIAEFCEWMAVHAYSRHTVKAKRAGLAMLASLAPEPDNGVLFLTVTGLKIHIENLSRLIASYVRNSGVGKPGSCHLFRHTMATLMLEGGADIRYVQQMLGHADISSTQIYTRVSLRKLEAVHAASHPGAANEPRGGASK